MWKYLITSFCVGERNVEKIIQENFLEVLSAIAHISTAASSFQYFKLQKIIHEVTVTNVIL